jgi:TolB-like protein
MKRIALLLCLAALLSAALASDADPYRDIATDIASAARALPGKTIAVMPFETAMGSDAGFARYAADKLTHELVSAGGVIVVERSKIARVVSEQELSASGAVSGDELSRLGRLLAVDALVFGTVSGAGGQREILVRLIDIRTGSILRSVSNTAPVAGEQSSATEAGAPRRKERPDTAREKGFVRVIGQEEDARGDLMDLHVVEHGRALYLNGRVSNPGKVVLEKPVVSVSFLDGDGRQITVAKAFADRHVNPGETLPLRGIIVPRPAGYKTYATHYRPAPDSFSSFVESMSSSQERFAKSAFGGYELTGVLSNPNSFSVKLAKIVVSLFDVKGRFIGSAYGFCGSKTLSPAETAPYRITIYPYSLSGRPARYSLHFAALKD